VKLLGKTGDKTYVKSLAGCLNDVSWWVRMNAARALIALGEVGVKALNQHDGATHD
jgi:HEAT repeat protein